MRPRATQGSRISITRVEAHQGGIWAFLQQEVYVQRRGWVAHGPETRARIAVEHLLVDEICDLVADEQYRQEKARERDDHNQWVLDNPELPFGLM